MIPDFTPPEAPRRAWFADACLLSAALIWGSGFVAQRQISEHLGPLTFNAFRNLIALAVLLPLVLGRRYRHASRSDTPAVRRPGFWMACLTTGGALFAGSWLQQAGIAQTTAGNAGFITGLYVVLVPILGVFLGSRPGAATWTAALLAAGGMYLLSATDTGALGRGDLLVLASTGFWAIHVHAVGHFAKRWDGLELTVLQLVVSTILMAPFALLLETWTATGLRTIALPLLYSGIICCALGFALQITGQRNAPPSHAAILMSLESVSAAFFGAWFLGERLGLRGYAGAALMFIGMLISQWPRTSPPKPRPERLPTSSSSTDVSRGS